MNILITTAGRRVSLVRAFQSEAKRIEPDSKIFTVDMCPELSSACRISDGFFKVPRVTDPDYLDILTGHCIENEVDMLIPRIDAELLVLAENRESLEKAGIEVIISDSELIKICNDKRKTIDFFKNRAIPTPKIVEKENPSFPVYAKPYDGSGTENNFIIENARQVRDTHVEDEKLLFFEYIDQEAYNEYTLDLYYDQESELKCVVPRERIKIRTGEVLKGVTRKNHLIEFVREHLSSIPGARGCITLQLFLNKQTGGIECIEINPRFGGGYPLSYVAGANYPRWIIEEYRSDKTINYFEGWEQDLLMLRYDDGIFIHEYPHQNE